MKNSIWPWVAAIALLFALLAAGIHYFPGGSGAPAAPDSAASAPTPAEPAGLTRIERPPTETPPALAAGADQQPTQAPEVPLPPLDDSDEEALDWLAELLGADRLTALLVTENVLRNVVVTIDNLPRDHISERQRPVAPVPGSFMVAGPEDALVLNPENHDRYTGLVDLLARTDTRATANLYRRFYPLLRQAYEELGHGDGNFHQRLLEVIEHLLSGPQPRGAIELTRPNVLYEYADEQLEALSAGRKIMIRMGPQNASVVRQWLRAFRDDLS
jgi:hypothetical protein